MRLGRPTCRRDGTFHLQPLKRDARLPAVREWRITIVARLALRIDLRHRQAEHAILDGLACEQVDRRFIHTAFGLHVDDAAGHAHILGDVVVRRLACAEVHRHRLCPLLQLEALDLKNRSRRESHAILARGIGDDVLRIHRIRPSRRTKQRELDVRIGLGFLSVSAFVCFRSKPMPSRA